MECKWRTPSVAGLRSFIGQWGHWNRVRKKLFFHNWIFMYFLEYAKKIKKIPKGIRNTEWGLLKATTFGRFFLKISFSLLIGGIFLQHIFPRIINNFKTAVFSNSALKCSTWAVSGKNMKLELLISSICPTWYKF